MGSFTPDEQRRLLEKLNGARGYAAGFARLRAADPATLRSSKTALTLETTAVGLDPDDIFWPLYGAESAQDPSLVSGLLRRARAEADPSKRAELYKQVSKLTRTEVSRIPLLYVDRASAVSARISGYTAQPNASFITLWFKP